MLALLATRCLRRQRRRRRPRISNEPVEVSFKPMGEDGRWLLEYLANGAGINAMRNEILLVIRKQVI